MIGGHRPMDNLTYWYPNTSNRLDHVDDAVAAGTPSTDIDDQNALNYAYDVSGRLIADAQEQITKILWSPYNKVLAVGKVGGLQLRFVYDAQGNRIKKTVVGGGAGNTTYYVREAGGKVIAIYTKACVDPEDFEGGGELGCAEPSGPADGDHDGIPDDRDNSPLTFNPDQHDADGDGDGDATDPDNDGDGIFDIGDPCPFDPTNSCTGDVDSDGIPDASDPCPNVPGTGGGDRDSDGNPDGCDTDLDGDGVPNNEDNCPWTYNPEQKDLNSNGIGDICECAEGEGGGGCPIMLAEQYVYGSAGDGRVATVFPDRNRDVDDHSTVDTIFTRHLREKEYELNDHLGNVRVRFGDLKRTAVAAGAAPFLIDLRGYTNYYPFGMVQPGREVNIAGGRYGYNGKEMDNEWNNRNGGGGQSGEGNSYDYGERVYDPRLGRWLSREPLENSYPGLSPYVYVANSPSVLIDKDGREFYLLFPEGTPDYEKAMIMEMVTDMVMQLRQYSPEIAEMSNSGTYYILINSQGVNVHESRGDRWHATGLRRHLVMWDPFQAYYYPLRDAKESSAGVFLHEMMHLYYWVKDPDRVIARQSGADWALDVPYFTGSLEREERRKVFESDKYCDYSREELHANYRAGIIVNKMGQQAANYHMIDPAFEYCGGKGYDLPSTCGPFEVEGTPPFHLLPWQWDGFVLDYKEDDLGAGNELFLPCGPPVLPDKRVFKSGGVTQTEATKKKADK